MNSDIRLAIAFKGHRKRKKLRKLIGDRADSYLIDFWLTVATDCPDGILAGWSDDDVAYSCDWDGEPKEFTEALVQSGWLDTANDGFIVHDWEEHQGWACHSKKRSEVARNAANKRWESKRGIDNEDK